MMNITTSISISSNRESAMQLVERMNMIRGIKLLLIALSSLILLAGNVSAKAIIYYVHNDHLGTPQILTDDNQQVVWKANYKPFGEAVVDEDPDGDGELVEFNVRLPGQYYDKETGLHYNYYRDYDPSLGRYIQSDPVGILMDYRDPARQLAAEMGLRVNRISKIGYLNNNYGYVDGNPNSTIDLTGEGAEVVIVIVPIAAVLYGFACYKEGLEACGEMYPNSRDLTHSDYRAHIQCTSGVTSIIARGMGMGTDPFGTAASALGEAAACSKDCN
jgi:RHS repeat-associated protein